MKSYGKLWELIVSEENLLEAWHRAKKGHGSSPGVLTFGGDLQRNISSLREDLISGRYEPGEFYQFRIKDPKPRTISCAPVRDRVLHHALCGVIAPLLERSFIANSFACRVGKGSHLACRTVRRLAGEYSYYCKIDVRHYFDSIDHKILSSVLLPVFREKELRDLILHIINHRVPGQARGKGLPIGNLTSQWFANSYLNGLDHFMVERLGRGNGYVRYMDDILFFAQSKDVAWRLHDEAENWLREFRDLELKSEATRLAPVSVGIPFLGLRIFPSCWRLQRGRFLRTRRLAAKRFSEFENGLIEEEKFTECITSVAGGLRWFGFKNILSNFG